ncbi:MAG: hypothetical protein ACFFC7_32920 [Candidatus Hermodarchaeota archaeon]
MKAGNVRNIPPLTVEHAPIRSNRAHTNIKNLPKEREDLLEISEELADIFQRVIYPLKF